MVPLSDHEQRQLEQIEQALYADYPRFANAVRASDPRVHYRRRLIAAALGLLVGVGGLVAGLVTRYIWISVAGFVVMLASCLWALSSYRHMAGLAAGRRLGRSPAARVGRSRQRGPRGPGRRPVRVRRGRRPAGAGMMERLEERWRRRQERGG